MKVSCRFVPLGFIVNFVFFVFLASPTSAEVRCGQQIGPEEEVTLTQDWECGSAPTALTLVGPNAVLNLGRHTVDCETRPNSNGILIMESGATLTNGTITRCTSGVAIRGAGSHTVTNVEARSNSSVGFSIFPGRNGNTLTHNTALQNISIRSLQQGFRLESGNHYTLNRNIALRNGTKGIQLVNGAMDSTLRGNLALDNKGTDLVDDNFPVCDNNNWSFNFFRTRNQTCIR